MSVLKDLQQSIADQISANPFFANIPVVTENAKDISSVIQQAVSKLGICCIVITPSASVSSPDYPKPYFDRVRIVVRVFEQPTLNRSTGGTQTPALDAAEMVAGTIHQFNPPTSPTSGVTDINTTVFLDSPSISLVPDKTYLVYDVLGKTQIGIDTVFSKLPALTASLTSGTLTASESQAGAAIFYTTDGTSPAPANPTATLYTAPVTGITSGSKVRARAWLWGFLPTDEFKATA